MRYPKVESRKRSLTRSIIWRIFGVLFLALVTYIYTHNWITTTLVTVLHHSIFIVVYYLHERFWLRIKWLRNSRFKPFARVFTYEIILGNLILGIITLLLTGKLHTMTLITLTYITNKYWMFYVYDYVEQDKMADQIRVYAYVVGDLTHIGHLKALQQAKELGDFLIVGVLTDEAVEAYKRKPVMPFNERIEMIGNLKCVDMVVRQDSVDPTENLKALRPDIVVHGDDWKEDFPGAEYMRSIGKRAIRTRYYEGTSTTKIIKTIKERADL